MTLFELITECVDGCVLADEDHDCCAREHGDCDGFGCDDCHQGLLWQVP